MFVLSNKKEKKKKKKPYLILVLLYASAFVVRWIKFLISSIHVHTRGFLGVPLLNDCLHGPAHNSNPETIKTEVFINWSIG
jgi:hypothetical protein